MTSAALGLFLIATTLAQPASSAAGRLDLEPEDVHSGEIAQHRSAVDSKTTANRIEAKPAFVLDGSPHPRLPNGPFTVEWSGFLSIRDTGPIAFSAFVQGSVTVQIADTTVLDGTGTADAE